MLLRGLSWTFQEQKAIPGSVGCAGSTAERQGAAPRTVPAATRAPGRLPAPAGDVHERSPARPRHPHPGFHLCSDKHPECHRPPCPRSAGTSPARGTETRPGPRPRCRGQMVAPVPLSPPATLGGHSAGKPSREGTEATGNARGQPRAPRRHQGRARAACCDPPCPPRYANPCFLWQNPPGHPGQKPSRSIPAEGSWMTPQQPLRAAGGMDSAPPALQMLAGGSFLHPAGSPRAAAGFARSWDWQSSEPRPRSTHPGVSPLKGSQTEGHEEVSAGELLPSRQERCTRGCPATGKI